VFELPASEEAIGIGINRDGARIMKTLTQNVALGRIKIRNDVASHRSATVSPLQLTNIQPNVLHFC
jgi:hypothetical protein